ARGVVRQVRQPRVRRFVVGMAAPHRDLAGHLVETRCELAEVVWCRWRGRHRPIVAGRPRPFTGRYESVLVWRRPVHHLSRPGPRRFEEETTPDAFAVPARPRLDRATDRG